MSTASSDREPRAPGQRGHSAEAAHMRPTARQGRQRNRSPLTARVRRENSCTWPSGGPPRQSLHKPSRLRNCTSYAASTSKCTNMSHALWRGPRLQHSLRLSHHGEASRKGHRRAAALREGLKP